MTLLVTGAAGFIGSSVALALLERGEQVIGIDNLNDYYDPALKRARLERLSDAHGSAFAFEQVDFSDSEAVKAFAEPHRFDRIVHLGAQAGVRYSLINPQAYVRSNLVGQINLLELARHRQVKHLVYASSSSVYGGNETLPFRVEDRVDHPISIYAATKKSGELMSESYAHLYRIPMTGLRFFTVYGPWGRPDMAMWIFTKALFEGRPLQIFNGGDMRRDFTFIDDIVRGVLACIDGPPADDGQVKAGGSKGPHAIYNIGNHRSEELMRMVGLLEQATGKTAALDFRPMQPGDVKDTFADISAIQRDHGFEPSTTIDVGIPRFVDWFKQYHRIDWRSPRMPVPAIFDRLRLPIIGAPLFIVSNPDLVIAQCKAGIVGSFPALNARPQKSQLDEWIHQITEELAAHDRDHPDALSAPFAVNQIVHRSNDRFEEDMTTCAKWKVPIVITSLGARTELNDAVHGWGGITLHDIIDDRYARKAIEKGADGLIAVAAGAGGHAGRWSPFALVQEIRKWFDGPLGLSGAIATGGAVLAATAMGADFAYIGSPFIATPEARATDEYKHAIIEGGAADIVTSALFTGVSGNYLRKSIVAAGLDPDDLPQPGPDAMNFESAAGAKAWRDIWGSGQGIGVVDKVTPAAELIDRLATEYTAARARVCG